MEENNQNQESFFHEYNKIGRQCVKDGLLYSTSLMIGITLANYFRLGIVIQDPRLVFIDYLIYGIGVCIFHYISDKISLYITSKLIYTTIKEEKRLSGKIFLIPWFVEVLFDITLLIGFVFLSMNVMFESLFLPYVLVLFIRITNSLFEKIIIYLTGRGR